MAAAGYLFHSNLSSGIAPGWYTIGENVGVGYSVRQVHDALVGSSSHRANMLSTAFNQVGVGAYTGADGRIWIVQVFVGR
jgi:uncharacterized protein YkwD